MGKRLIIRGADFSENGFLDEGINLTFSLGGFSPDGTYWETTNRCKSQPAPAVPIISGTSINNLDNVNLSFGFCIKNLDDTPYDVSGIQSWNTSDHLDSSVLEPFIGKYLQIAVKFNDDRDLSQDDIDYISSKVLLNYQ